MERVSERVGVADGGAVIVGVRADEHEQVML